MMASDPHRGEKIYIETYLENGWVAYGFDENHKTMQLITLDYDSAGKKIACVSPIEIELLDMIHRIKWETYIKVKNVYIENFGFYDVYLRPPYDGGE